MSEKQLRFFDFFPRREKKETPPGGYDALERNKPFAANETDAAGMEVKPTIGLDDPDILSWLGLREKLREPLNEATYLTCLKMLSETIAKMPIKGYEASDDGVREISSSEDRMLYLLKKRPNPYMTPTIFWNAVELNRNHYGNGYFWIQRDFKRSKYGGTETLRNLWIMPSDDVTVLIDNAGIFADAGRIWYRYTDRITSQEYIFGSDDVFHVKTSLSFDGITGVPVRLMLKTMMEGRQAAQEYNSKLYSNGMTAKAVLEYTGELTKDSQEKLKKVFAEYGAGVKNVGSILPVPLGMKLTPLNIKLSDAQFAEMQKYTALQLAAAMGIKPNQINDYEKSSYANSEMQQLSFLVDTVLFIIKQYEDELNYKCVSPESEERGRYYKFNEKSLLRTDSKSQMEIFASGVNNGVYRVNEVRGKLDLPRDPDGDRLMVNGNYIPLSDVGKQWADKAAPDSTAGKKGDE